MNHSAVRSAAGAIALALMAAAVAEAAEVRTSLGVVAGAELGAADAYYAIPYAAPPLGALRWMPPAPAPVWEGVRDASRPGPQCPQNAELGVFSQAGGAEDCLYLNVYVPRDAGTAPLPVLVWIHGGGYFVGAANDHDGASLAARAKAIVVTLNYRLGILGFFGHPALNAEGHPFANYGLMDQQAALRWVHDNAAAFGGDPGNVTIFGESSGGTSVMSHVVSPGAAGLFQHAIAMSGTAIVIKPGNFAAPPPMAQAETMATGFAQAVGCADTACLRALPVETILAAQPAFMTNQAFIDGTVLPTSYAEALQSGRFNRGTLVIGSTLDEWLWAVGFAENASGTAMTAAAYPAALAGYYGEALAKKVEEAYPLSDYLSPSEAYGAAATASLMACTARKAAEWAGRHQPVWVYEFADRTAPSYLDPTSFALGAAHTYEIPYLFEGYHGGAGNPVALNPLQQKLSAEMIADFASAASRGATEDRWPRYDVARDNVMTYVLPAARLVEGRFAKVHKCAFWDALGIY